MYPFNINTPSDWTSCRLVNLKLLDLGRVPYVVYGVKYIDLVSLDAAKASQSQSLTSLRLKWRKIWIWGCVLIPGPGTLGTGAKTRLHTPKAVTYHTNTVPLWPYHAQGCDLSCTASYIINHTLLYIRFMIGHSLPLAYGIQSKEVLRHIVFAGKLF